MDGVALVLLQGGRLQRNNVRRAPTAGGGDVDYCIKYGGNFLKLTQLKSLLFFFGDGERYQYNYTECSDDHTTHYFFYYYYHEQWYD